MIILRIAVKVKCKNARFVAMILNSAAKWAAGNYYGVAYSDTKSGSYGDT